MKLYLIRHAQSANNQLWNGSDQVDGRQPDPEITDIGHRQAELLGEHLAHPLAEPRQHPYLPVDDSGFGLTHLYCSLMTRSILTAQYIANQCEIEQQALPDIFEKNGVYEFDEQGEMQGLPGPGREYFANRFPLLNLPESIGENGWWDRPAEDHEEFIGRVRSVVRSLKQQAIDAKTNIAMVVHSDFIDQFVNELMGVTRHGNNYKSDWVANWAFHNTSISRFDFNNGAHSVVYLNRIDHLPAELVTW
ncbi:MAG: histidine phosphatase family protein [Gammaproteobacteria bacterium]|nr:histidine phosphatase family protein [Gammaproteobacteria bacterium]